jgi:hypothetical protein
VLNLLCSTLLICSKFLLVFHEKNYDRVFNGIYFPFLLYYWALSLEARALKISAQYMCKYTLVLVIFIPS